MARSPLLHRTITCSDFVSVVMIPDDIGSGGGMKNGPLPARKPTPGVDDS